jgi:glycosyltransferase involved in cell wall biosynthesis
MLVLFKSTQDESVLQFRSPRNLIRRFYNRLSRIWRNHQLKAYATSRRDVFQPFSDDRTEYQVDVCSFASKPDVVNLYWIGGFVDYRYFFRNVPSNLPIVWRLSDENAYTGGCHYSYECHRWLEMCGACPELGSSRESDLSRDIWKRKADSYKKHRIEIVSPSKWLASEAKRSSLLGDQPVTIIPNGLDTSVFAPRDRMEARKALGLPADRVFILAGGHHLQDERKGFHYLVSAARKMRTNQPITFLLLGKGDLAALNGLPLPYKCLGFIQEDRELACAYAAADFCVIPSCYDNLPNMAVEAMACGIPVVAFKTGGLADIVHHGKTGLLAEWKKGNSLAAQMLWLLDHPDECRRMGESARKLVEQEHTLEIQARRFAELYQAAIGTDDQEG